MALRILLAAAVTGGGGTLIWAVVTGNVHLVWWPIWWLSVAAAGVPPIGLWHWAIKGEW